jgi:hypothetical protein
MSAEEPSPISRFLSPISYLERPRATSWRAGVLVGPTAVGKSDVAQWIAERVGAPILSADSMLVYRGMDIGTAKPTPAERGDVPYFGIDCVDPGEPFSTGAWLSFVRRQLAEVQVESGKRKVENKEVIAVLDIDSRELNTFDDIDARWLEQIVKHIP